MTWLLAGIVLAPIIHWWIRSRKWWGVRTVIASLMFVPGLCITAWLAWFYINIGTDVNRWSLVYHLQGRGALRCLALITLITAAYFGVCLILEHFSRRTDGDEDGGKIRVVEAWRSLIAIQLVLMAVATYIYNYNSLADAVTSDNLALVEKRLNWNLEGLVPNNGLVVSTGSGWLERYPLLPVAAKNGNYDMVKLLVKHGADLNPKDWDEELGLPSGVYVKNPLYFAVMNHDVEMIDLLIDLGVNPEHGIEPALSERDRELLNLFLEKGVSLDFALGVAEEKGYSQQLIDRLFADHIPKIRVEASQ